MAYSSYSGPQIGVLLAASAPPAASIGWCQSIICGYAAASPAPHPSASPSPLSLERPHGDCDGDIGGAGWASAAGPGVDGVLVVVAGKGSSGPTGAEACRGRCGGGEVWSLAAQQAEQARVRLGAGFGGSEGGDMTGETAASGVVGHGICVDRVRWLAWWASCVDCVSSCGSTVPAVARVGEAGAGWEQRGVAESMSLAVGYRGLRCAMGHAMGCRLQRGRVRCRARESAASVDQSVGQLAGLPAGLPVCSDGGLGVGVTNAGTPGCLENPTGAGPGAKGLVSSRGAALEEENVTRCNGRGKLVVQYQD